MLNQFVGNMIKDYNKQLITAYIADVISVSADGAMAQVRPRSALGAPEKAVVSAVVPPNIKSSVKTVKYMTGATAITTVTESHSATTTIQPQFGEIEVYVPEKLSIGDVVYCGVCDTELHEVNDGTERIHDINNSVILCVCEVEK